MNSTAIDKPAKIVKTKPVKIKATSDQETQISHLKQEIRTLSKMVKEMQMQKKPDTEVLSVTIPSALLTRLNVYLLNVNRAGNSTGLSEYVAGTIEGFMLR